MVCLAIALIACAPARLDLTSKQALEVARRFLVAAKLPPPTTPLTVRWTQYGYMPGSWDVGDNARYLISIGEGASAVTGFSNMGREYEISKKINRTGKRRFATEKDARAYSMNLARDLGLPSQAILEEFKYGTERGEIVARWIDKPFGYRGLNGTTISLDMQDGALKFYGSHWSTRTSKPNVKITKAQAERVASAAYLKGPPYRRFHDGPLDPKRTDLQWVIPNTSFTAKRYLPPQASPVARLAYLVHFGGNAVFVDAETGAVIGGLILG